MIVFITAACFAITGVLSGWFIPAAAERIVRAKYTGHHLSLSAKVPLKASLSIANGAIWILAAVKLQDLPSALLLAALITVSVLVTIIDLNIRMIPNELVLAILLAGALFQLLHYGALSLLQAGLCMAALLLMLLVSVFILGSKKVGAGDIKLIAVTGLVSGYPHILYSLVITSIAILIYCLTGLLLRKLRTSSMFPYAPFIMLGMASSLTMVLFGR